jgi:hypothetical protein
MKSQIKNKMMYINEVHIFFQIQFFPFFKFHCPLCLLTGDIKSVVSKIITLEIHQGQNFPVEFREILIRSKNVTNEVVELSEVSISGNAFFV